MTTVSETTDRTPLGEPVTATEQLLNAKHADLLRDTAKLAELHDTLTTNAQQEREARDFLAYMAEIRQLHGELELIVSTNHDLLDSASQRTGWKPPQEGPLPIGDSIRHDTLTTLGTPAVRYPDAVPTLVGLYVHIWWPTGPDDGLRGFLHHTERGLAVIEDGQGNVIAEVPIADVTRIEQWVSGDPTGTLTAAGVCSCDRKLVISEQGPPVHVDDYSVTCRTDLLPASDKHLTRTGNQPKGGRDRG